MGTSIRWTGCWSAGTGQRERRSMLLWRNGTHSLSLSTKLLTTEFVRICFWGKKKEKKLFSHFHTRCFCHVILRWLLSSPSQCKAKYLENDFFRWLFHFTITIFTWKVCYLNEAKSIPIWIIHLSYTGGKRSNNFDFSPVVLIVFLAGLWMLQSYFGIVLIVFSYWIISSSVG